MEQKGQRIRQSCPTCTGRSTKKGYLWLGGSDYLECPDCGGTGTFVMYERKVTPPKIFIMSAMPTGRARP